MIKLENATFSYNGDIAPIKNFSMELNNGVYAITGDSGCGKSTLLKGIAGLIRPVSGIVHNDLRCSYVFQENRLIMSLSAEANIHLVCNSKERIEFILSQIGLSDCSKRPVCELSGGQQRRVAIARSLCYDADYVILDEPFEGLDKELKNKISELIKDKYSLIIVSSHDKSDFTKFTHDEHYTEINISNGLFNIITHK